MQLKRILKWSASVLLLVVFVWFQFAYWSSTNDCRRSIPAGAQLMKAIKYCEYGPPDVLQITEVEKPVPNDNELLVKVYASSLNFIDNAIVSGPWILRPMSGLRKPKFTGF